MLIVVARYIIINQTIYVNLHILLPLLMSGLKDRSNVTSPHVTVDIGNF